MNADSLQQQIEYYRARAGEYDEWFFRKGRYDRGPEHNAQWFAETDQLASALDTFQPTGKVLELACGTGLWTTRLARHATQVTAVDASSEVLALNRDRVASPAVTYVEADVFAWEPPVAQFDVVFFSFWLSHVPPERFESFWALVGRALRPGGRFFLIDSRYAPSSTAIDHRLTDRADTVQTRRLNDGREFEIYKVFYEPDKLAAQLERLGWTVEAHQTATYFIYASGRRGESPRVPDSLTEPRP